MPKTVWLRPGAVPKQSVHHTSYAGDGPLSGGELHKIVFVKGRATNVDEQVYERFKDLGHCQSNRPNVDDM